MPSVVLKYQIVFWYYLYMIKNHLKITTKHTTQLCHQSCQKEKEMTETKTTQINTTNNPTIPDWMSESSYIDGKNKDNNYCYLQFWEMCNPEDYTFKPSSKHPNFDERHPINDPSTTPQEEEWWIRVGRHLEEEMDRIGLDRCLSREEKNKKLKPLFEKRLKRDGLNV